MLLIRIIREILLVITRLGFLWVIFGLILGFVWTLKGLLLYDGVERNQYLIKALLAVTGGFIIIFIALILYMLMIRIALLFGVVIPIQWLD